MKHFNSIKVVLRMLCFAAVFTFAAACTKKTAPETKEDQPSEKKEENVVVLTKQNLEHVQIQSEAATLGSLELTMKTAGRVSENLNKTARIASTLEGRLIKMNFDVNDKVKAGDILALVQAPELLGKALEIKAPIDGVVTERRSTVGELVGKDTEIFTISDPAGLWMIAEVKERDIASVKIGQEVKFKVLPYPEEEFRGQIVRLGNRVEEDSRTLEARIEVNNVDGKLKAGMFADVEIVTTLKENALLISDTALQTDGDDQIVFVEQAGGKFEKRLVEIGMEQSGRVQILSGVKPGEKVVTQGSFILKSEMLKGELGEE